MAMGEYNSNNIGEVAAISGYDFQYEIFASEIYSYLLNNELEWVELASSQAGKLDDVLIGLDSKILAFQSKNINSSTFSYLSFVKSDTESIFQGVFQGWKKLKNANPAKSIDARFITTQLASENDKLDSYTGTSKATFKSFIDNFFIPIKEGKYSIETIPNVWKKTFEELKTFVKANDDELIDFIKDFSFVFNYKQNYFRTDSYTEAKRKLDIEKISTYIPKIIARKGNVRLTKEQCLEEFDLKYRFETYFNHSFFVNENYYQPIEDTINLLEKTVKENSKGYIALVGNAGSGKSTTLTKWLQNSDYNILKYYAYVNTDMNYISGFRGEARTFFHDIITQIRQNTNVLHDRLPTNDLQDLQKQFSDELKKLSYRDGKTIIVVDGLDHIEREQNVSVNLINLLPLEEGIPDNIFFILGSRTLQNLDGLPVRILERLKEKNSIINITPLTKSQIFYLINAYGLNIGDTLLEDLYVNTNAHPLFLKYTLEELKSSDEKDYEAIISQKKFTGDINTEYKAFWNKYKNEDSFIEILGVISRLRYSYFDVNLLKAFQSIKRQDAERVNKVSEFYFYKKGNIWQFFHSSFKEFLINETALNPFTQSFDETIDKEFHLKICTAFSNGSIEYKWNEVFHLFKAKEYSQITSLITQDYFREQWFEFRAYQFIKEDIRLALLASSIQKDVLCLYRCFFALFEIKQRINNFNPVSHFETFHQLNKIDLANSFIIDNVGLLVSQDTALRYAVLLYQKDYKELAHEIFLKAYPTFLLRHSKIANTRRYIRETHIERDEVELLATWAKTASLFLPIENIVQELKPITVEADKYPNEERNLLSEAIFAITELTIETKSWASLKQVESIIISELTQDHLFYFYFEIVINLENENEFYDKCLFALNTLKTSEVNPIIRRLLITEVLIKKEWQNAIPLFEKLLRPNQTQKNDSIEDNGFIDYVFDYARFFYIIKKDFSVSPSTFLPIQKKHTLTAFYLAIAELGKSYAYIYHNAKDASLEFLFRFEQILKLSHYYAPDDDYEYKISYNKHTLVNLTLKISLQVSLDVFNEVLSRITKEWSLNGRFWQTVQIQNVIEWVIDSRVNNTWCSKHLELIDNNLLDIGDVAERIEKITKQISLWSKLNELEKGNILLEKVLKISLDVRSEKDNQLGELIRWIDKLKLQDADELEYYLKRLDSLSDRASSASSAQAQEILQLSLPYGNGYEIFSYLLFAGLEDFSNGVESILTYLLTKNPSKRKLYFKLFFRIVVAYDNYHSARSYFLKKLFDSSIDFGIDELLEIIDEIKVYSILEHRDKYLFKVQEYLEERNINPCLIGISEKIEIRDGYTEVKSDVLTFGRNETITEKELLEKVKNIQDLILIGEKADSSRSFDWSKVYEQVISNCTDEELISYVNNNKLESLQLTEFANSLIKKGKIAIAKTTLYNAIQKGQAYGWITFYDGGSKVKPFESLYAIEEQGKLQDAAFADFSSSIIDLGVDALESLVSDIITYTKYFKTQIDYGLLYEEVKKFRNTLLQTHSISSDVPTVKGCFTDEDLEVDILFFIVTLPSNFDDVMFPILLEELEDNSNTIERLLNKLFDAKFYEIYVQFLSGIRIKNIDFIRTHLDNLKTLSNNPRFDLHNEVCRILWDLGIDFEDLISVQTKTLPLTYQMQFEHIPDIISPIDLDIDHIDNKGFLKETNNVLTYVKVYLYEIEILAKETKFDIVNIAYRIIDLGNNDLEFPDWGKNINEEEVRKIYKDKLNLQISYKRPRNQKNWIGLMKVIRELWEWNLISREVAVFLSNKFDENNYFIKPKAKPNFIHSILNKSGYAPSSEKGWTKEITDEYVSNVCKLKVEEDCFLLAEHSIIHSMGDGRAVEYRESMIDITKEVEDNKYAIFYGTVVDKIDDYFYANDNGICLYNLVQSTNPKVKWLAINPAIADAMGLFFNSAEGNFRWDDKDGNTIVESIYWQNSTTQNSSRNLHSESGEGWYVIISKKGFEKLKKVLKQRNLYHHKRIKRYLKFTQSRYGTYIDEENKNYVIDKI